MNLNFFHFRFFLLRKIQLYQNASHQSRDDVLSAYWSDVAAAPEDGEGTSLGTLTSLKLVSAGLHLLTSPRLSAFNCKSTIVTLFYIC